jgi:DNA-binding PadR family transcriptional regulator
MIAQEPSWGYKLMSLLNERHGVKVGPAVMYPLLDSMSEKGVISSREALDGKRMRKVYTATDKGLQEIGCLEQILLEIFQD